MNVIVRQPGSLPSFAIQEMAEGARFEPESGVKMVVSRFQSFNLLQGVPPGCFPRATRRQR